MHSQHSWFHCCACQLVDRWAVSSLISKIHIKSTFSTPFSPPAYMIRIDTVLVEIWFSLLFSTLRLLPVPGYISSIELDGSCRCLIIQKPGHLFECLWADLWVSLGIVIYLNVLILNSYSTKFNPCARYKSRNIYPRSSDPHNCKKLVWCG